VQAFPKLMPGGFLVGVRFDLCKHRPRIESSPIPPQDGASVCHRDEVFPRRIYHDSSNCLVCSIKGKVKKKNLPRGWTFSTFAAHFIEQDLF
jgi:hypothetical protein